MDQVHDDVIVNMMNAEMTDENPTWILPCCRVAPSASAPFGFLRWSVESVETRREVHVRSTSCLVSAWPLTSELSFEIARPALSTHISYRAGVLIGTALRNMS